MDTRLPVTSLRHLNFVQPVFKLNWLNLQYIFSLCFLNASNTCRNQTWIKIHDIMVLQRKTQQAVNLFGCLEPSQSSSVPKIIQDITADAADSVWILLHSAPYKKNILLLTIQWIGQVAQFIVLQTQIWERLCIQWRTKNHYGISLQWNSLLTLKAKC